MDPSQSLTYDSNDLELFLGGTQESIFEKRILHWLESRSLAITDPLQKQDAYYQTSKRKVEKLRSLRSGPSLSESQGTKDASYNSLPSFTNLESHKSLEFIPEGNFLKESNTWKLKNRRRGTGNEQIERFQGLANVNEEK